MLTEVSLWKVNSKDMYYAGKNALTNNVCIEELIEFENTLSHALSCNINKPLTNSNPSLKHERLGFAYVRTRFGTHIASVFRLETSSFTGGCVIGRYSWWKFSWLYYITHANAVTISYHILPTIWHMSHMAANVGWAARTI